MAQTNAKYSQMENRISLERQDQSIEQVSQLILDRCYASQISGLTDQFVNLEMLSMIKVGLVTLDGFPALPKLRKLELCDNQLSGGLDPLVSSKNLQELDMSGNNIQDLDALKPLQNLPNLASLDLFECAVTDTFDYRKKVFDMLPNLKTLDGDIQEDELYEPPAKRPAIEVIEPQAPTASNLERGAPDNQEATTTNETRGGDQTVEASNDVAQDINQVPEENMETNQEKCLPEPEPGAAANEDLEMATDNLDSEIVVNSEKIQPGADIDDDNRMDVGLPANDQQTSEVAVCMDDGPQASAGNESTRAETQTEAEVTMRTEDNNQVALSTVPALDSNDMSRVTPEIQDGVELEAAKINESTEVHQQTVSLIEEKLETTHQPENINVSTDIDMTANNASMSSEDGSQIETGKETVTDVENDKANNSSAEYIDEIKETVDESVITSEPVITLNDSSGSYEEMGRAAEVSVEIIEEEEYQRVDDSAVDEDDVSDENQCIIDDGGEYSEEEDDHDENDRIQEDISIQEIGSSEDVENHEDTSYDEEDEVSEGEIISGEESETSDEEEDQEVTQLYNASPSSPNE